tara:strand:+ start:70 stop:267 length:198 start_codon:yes stop_codon:yes gene_type:complete
MYNINNPSNWSWSRAFDEMAKTVRKAEYTQQVINHLHNYDGGEKSYPELSSRYKQEMYHILYQIL